MERVMGVEPTSSAWKAEVIAFIQHPPVLSRPENDMVEGGGFEPPKAEPADLQSAPFGHSGTPPKSGSRILCVRHTQLSTKKRPKSCLDKDRFQVRFSKHHKQL